MVLRRTWGRYVHRKRLVRTKSDKRAGGRGGGPIGTNECRSSRCPVFTGLSACPGKHFEVNVYATTFRGYSQEAWIQLGLAP